MRAAKYCTKRTAAVAIALLVAFAVTPALAKTTAPVCPKIKGNQISATPDTFACVLGDRAGGWHFVLTSITSKNLCPATITVTLDSVAPQSCGVNGPNFTVPLSSYQGGTCFYDLNSSNANWTPDCLTASMAGASTNGGTCTTQSQFNLSSAPCSASTEALGLNYPGALDPLFAPYCDANLNVLNQQNGGCPVIADDNGPVNPVTVNDLPLVVQDKIYITNPSVSGTGNVHFKRYLDEQCTQLAPSDGGTITISGATGLSAPWTIPSGLQPPEVRAFEACLVDSAGNDLVCSGCEFWPIVNTPGGGCTDTIGFWKTHGPGLCLQGNNTDQWNGVVLTELNFTDEAGMCAVLLSQPKLGQHCLQLERQLIGTLLNKYVNNADTTQVDTAIAQAESLILGNVNGINEAACNLLIPVLDTFNQGLDPGVPHCGNETP